MAVDRIRQGVALCCGDKARTASFCESFGCSSVLTVLEALDAANARAARLEQALRTYADPASYRVDVRQEPGGRIHISGAALADCGLTARQALEEL